ncbi:MAG: DegT/DnrJ/EryC1/StrS family aminotransferase [bacterium]|nr:DegT/DnrJ/EryC1/StrS family aminotransferase [bacterium]MCM1374633.1 DegT/DnrJ/EryC1/StrS family aminotransferase [Muribaculum sp.]
MGQNEKILVTKSSMPPYEEYINAIKPLWNTHWLTNMGVYHKELEQQLKEYLDVPELSLMVNGHMALEMAIQMMDFPKGAEVITTPFTFISTTHAIVRNGLKPVFCDVKLCDGTIDETQLEDLITEHTVAFVPVHVYGNVCNIEEINRIACKYNLKVIYDAAHAFGVKYKGKGIGSYGHASVFSFHATKVFNTIEGGAVTFKDSRYYEKLYDLKNFGIRGEELVVGVGANAKMNEFCAIMGLCNLKHIDDVLKHRKERYEFYVRKLLKIRGIELVAQEENEAKNYAYLPVRITSDFPMSRDEVYDMYVEHDIFARKYFYPLTADQACFRNKYKLAELPVARQLGKEILTLPLWDDIEFEQIEYIINLLEQATTN